MQNLIALAALAPAVLAQTYYGCYTEIPARALTGASEVNYTTMTIPDCATFCTGFALWGLEYSGECYCGNALAEGSFPAFSSDCNMACSGDANTTCGGPNRLSLYGKSADPPAVTPYPHPAVTTTTAHGCWTELTAGVRALDGATAFSESEMTVEACGTYCLNSGYTWFGTEYAAECYCGSALNVNSTQAANTDCAMACTGNVTEVCGGSDRLSVYQWV